MLKCRRYGKARANLLASFVSQNELCQQSIANTGYGPYTVHAQPRYLRRYVYQSLLDRIGADL